MTSQQTADVHQHTICSSCLSHLWYVAVCCLSISEVENLFTAAEDLIKYIGGRHASASQLPLLLLLPLSPLHTLISLSYDSDVQLHSISLYISS